MADTWFTIHRSQLQPAFAHVSSAVDKGNIPILSHVLFECLDGALRIRATNLDMQIQAECELLSFVEKSAFAVPALKINDILRQLPEDAVLTFGTGRTADQIGIKSNRSTFSVPFLPPADFPEIRGRVDLEWVEIDGGRLADGIAKATFAVDQKNYRIYLTGLCLHADAAETGMVLCGTDGLSLARIEMSGSGTPRFPKKSDTYRHVILPTRGAECVRKILEGAKSPARMAVTEDLAAFSYGGIEVSTKLIDGTFPLYEQVIPARTEQTVIVSRESLTATVKRVCVAVDDSQNDGIRLKVNDGALQVDLLSGKGSFARDVIKAEIRLPEGFTISHNASRLEKLLSAMKSSDIELMLTDADTSAVYRPVGNALETYLLRPCHPRFVED